MTASPPGHWMKQLADHLREARESHPDAQLAVVFDIDGTIVDLRHTICYLLHRFDREQDSTWFSRLRPGDVRHHERRVDELLAERRLPEGVRRAASDYYQAHLWDRETVVSGHRAYAGVMEVIRCLQLQEQTVVVVSTGRPEPLRAATLESLNGLGLPYKARFVSEWLRMCPPARDREVADVKVDAVRALRDEGVIPVAVVDNEPEILAAIEAATFDPAPLLLHAETIYESVLPVGATFVSGRHYDLTELIGPGELPDEVDLVWHGINSEANLDAFLGSGIRWGECDVRADAAGRLIARHDDFELAPPNPDERPLTFERVVTAVAEGSDGALKADIKDPTAIDEVLRLLRGAGLPDDRLWFNADLDAIGADGFRRLRDEHPGAVLQCPGGFLAPLAFGAPDEAERVAGQLGRLGITRLSLSWSSPRLRELIDRFESWGFDVNVYGVRDLAEFLSAVLLLPRSVTADFNFPEWGLFGTGSGAVDDRAPDAQLVTTS